MTELQAVTIALEQVGIPGPSTLSGTLDSDVTDARAKVADALVRIMGQGWPCNTVRGLTLEVPTVTIGASGGAGTFTYMEVVTEAVSLATGYFDHESGGKVHLVPISGTFTGGQTLTGGTSAATRTGGVYALVTENQIAAPSVWLSIRSLSGGPEYTTDGGFVNKLDADNPNATTFSDSITVDVIEARAITELSPALADYVANEAGYRLQKYLKRAAPDDTNAREARTLARLAALRERRRQEQTTVTDTSAMTRFKGGRIRRA